MTGSSKVEADTATVDHTCLRVIEKATGNTLAELPVTTPVAIGQLVANARNSRWSRRSTDDRLRRLSTLRRLLASSAGELAKLLSQENGKPRHESLLHEVIPLLDAIDWIVGAVPETEQTVTLPSRWLKHRAHQVIRRPHGVCAILSPFNFPLLIPGVDAISALAMGCTAIIKPSEHCPLAVRRLVSLAHDAGICEDALQVVYGGSAVGQALLDAEVDSVVFTGAEANGRIIAVDCARKLRPFTLELGGNCPLLVLDDADLDRTAQAIAYGALANSGQSCLAVGRVLVPRRLESALAESLVPLMRKLRQGDPMLGPTELGSLTTAAQVERCRTHVETAISNGAKRLLGGSASPPPGHYFQPTLLSGCSFDDLVYREETFGPVIALVPYDDETMVLRALNADRAGLAAYVFGGNQERASAVARELDYGHVVVDHVLLTYICPDVPLSGFRNSGMGVVHGREGLLAHSRPRVLGTPKARLPAQLDFALLDPQRAETVAKTYLAASNVLENVTRFWKR